MGWLNGLVEPAHQQEEKKKEAHKAFVSAARLLCQVQGAVKKLEVHYPYYLVMAPLPIGLPIRKPI